MVCLSGFELYSRWVPLIYAPNRNRFELTMLLPNGRAVARGVYYIPSDDQNFKQGARMGA